MIPIVFSVVKYHSNGAKVEDAPDSRRPRAKPSAAAPQQPSTCEIWHALVYHRLSWRANKIEKK